MTAKLQKGTKEAKMNNDSKLGLFGTVTTFTSGGLGWLCQHEAELRAVSFAISIVVGLLTLAWWVRKWWKSFTSAADKLED